MSAATYTDPYSGQSTHVVNYAADQAELSALNMVTADPLRTPTFTAFAPADDFVNSVPAADASNSSASTTQDVNNAYTYYNGSNTKSAPADFDGCQGISGTSPPAACSESTYTYVHGDFSPNVDDDWAAFVGPGVEPKGQYGGVWTDETDMAPTALALAGLHEPYTPDGRVITQIIDPSDTSDPANTAALQSTDAQALGATLKELDAPVYMSAEGANDGFGPATLVADTYALAGGSSSDDSRYTNVEADITHITAERNAVVSDIQAQLMAAELNNTPTNGATDESEGTCILQYANALKVYAQNGGAQPTDCNVTVGTALPETSHPVLMVVAAGVIFAGAILLYGRRRRTTAA
jgi:hypothetical protein